jgi:hypothetical protein
VQNLPESVLSANQSEIISALTRAVHGDLSKDGGEITVDGLKVTIPLYHIRFHTYNRVEQAISNFLQRHPQHFFLPLSSLLPSILFYITSDCPELRFQAARVLNGLARAKLTCSATVAIMMTISRHVSSFIRTQASRKKSGPSVSRVFDIISSAFAVDSPTHPGEGPVWAFIVLASIIILHDHSLFSHPPSLKLIFPCLSQALANKRSAVRVLHPHVWKCLVWAFARIFSK